MTTPTTEQSIRSPRRRRGLVAIAAGVALLLGGGSYALWSDSDTSSGGSITAGDLSIVAGTAAYYDVSADRTDGTAVPGTTGVSGHTITPSSWLAVPGDTAAAVVPFTATLTGDNLVAALSLNGTTATLGESLNDDSDVTFQYQIFGTVDSTNAGNTAVGTTVTALTSQTALSTDQAMGTTPVAYLQAGQNGQAAGALDGSIPVLQGSDGSSTSNLTLVVYITFNDVSAQTDASDVLGTFTSNTLQLTQVRADGAPTPNNFFTPAP